MTDGPPQRGSVVARLRGIPVGSIQVSDLPPAEPARSDLLRRAAARELSDSLQHHLRAAGVAIDEAGPAGLLAAAERLPSAPRGLGLDLPLVTVVICTLGTEPRLRGVVEALLRQTYGHLEILVVDNNPGRSGVPTYLNGLQDPRVRVIDEPRRGASNARNAGLRASRSAITLFTDDDTLPDRHWVSEMIKVFEEDPQELIGGVTGLVTPGSLHTWHQTLFEEFGSFDKGYGRAIWTLASVVPPEIAAVGALGSKGVLFPYGGDVGSGNNMGFRTARLRAIGGFDPDLGPGTVTRGGEDLDVYAAMINAGDIMVYAPTALVRHFHRADADSLNRQLYDYGAGMAVVVTKHLLRSPREAARIIRNLPKAVHVLFSANSYKNARKTSDYPRSLTITELKGYAVGPILYIRAVARKRSAYRRGRRATSD
ncbi:Glycosyl transferase family 2 [Nakamurella panacisegetis]|uniref:Glycosyl transferase family 2 n=1 Tax=Nakamurella panacisegetis TaxID=1090615 RepID=A0A1H0LZY3_9ACTN|nr:glycosyltransferase [Nakamurella panacisegetis]SDO73772.1 Glycosyl transferase family 2 [Nakamurella panacisegetis]